MAIQSVNKSLRAQKGLSLIELMIASVLGIITLLAVGGVFLSGQKLAAERSQRLLVIQSINEALRYIKEDIQRAGFHQSNGQSFIISGADSVITSTPTSLDYGYQTGVSGGQPIYTQVGFFYDSVNKQLKFCQQPESSAHLLNPCSSLSYNVSTGPFSLLDSKRVRVDGFTVASEALGSTVSSALYTITLQASLLDGSHSQTLSTKIKQRNWK